MDQTKIETLKEFLKTQKLPADISAKMKNRIILAAKKFTIYKDQLYRYDTSNGIIRKVLNKSQAEEILYSYH